MPDRDLSEDRLPRQRMHWDCLVWEVGSGDIAAAAELVRPADIPDLDISVLSS